MFGFGKNPYDMTAQDRADRDSRIAEESRSPATGAASIMRTSAGAGSNALLTVSPSRIQPCRHAASKGAPGNESGGRGLAR